jgi:hypothetical protein
MLFMAAQSEVAVAQKIAEAGGRNRLISYK